MKNNYTQKFGIALTAVALFVASCGSNATFSKRYHNRGFNIAWGGGTDATPAKPVVKKARVEAEKSVIAESPAVELQAENTASLAAPLSPISGAVVPTAVVNNPVVLAAKATQTAAPAKLIEKKAVDHKVMVKATTKVLKQKKAMADPGAGKSQVIALILCIVVGAIGIHRFYLGYTMEGVLQLLTLGGCGIWTLIDLIRIITGDLKPKNGDYTETL